MRYSERPATAEELIRTRRTAWVVAGVMVIGLAALGELALLGGRDSGLCLYTCFPLGLSMVFVGATRLLSKPKVEPRGFDVGPPVASGVAPVLPPKVGDGQDVTDRP